MRVLFQKGFFSVSKLVFSRGVSFEFPLRIRLFGGVSRTFCYHVASQARSIASICWNSMVGKPRLGGKFSWCFLQFTANASTQSRWENALKVGREKTFQHTNANSAPKFTSKSRTVHLQGHDGHDQQKQNHRPIPAVLNPWNKACGSQIDPNDMKVATYFPGGLGRKNDPAPGEKSKT